MKGPVSTEVGSQIARIVSPLTSVCVRDISATAHDRALPIHARVPQSFLPLGFRTIRWRQI